MLSTTVTHINSAYMMNTYEFIFNIKHVLRLLLSYSNANSKLVKNVVGIYMFVSSKAKKMYLLRS